MAKPVIPPAATAARVEPEATASAATVLVTLGTRGGPSPTADRSQSSNLLIVDGKLYLIDAGDNVTRRIVQADNDFKAVDKIFLTHLHGDHTAGLATLIGAAWDYQRRTPIDIFGSGVEQLVSAAVSYLTPNAEIRASTGKNTPLTDVVRAHEIKDGLIYQDEHVKVFAAENSHFQFEPGSALQRTYKSYSYRFETKSRVVVFTGDTGPSEAVTELARGADVLVTEVGDPDAVVAAQKQSGVWAKKTDAERAGLLRHLRQEHVVPESIGRMASDAGVKSVVLTHLVPTVDPHDTYERYVGMVKRFYAGPVFVARDLQRF